MNNIIYLFVLIAALIILQKLLANNRKDSAKAKSTPIYQYGRKAYIMTKAEHNFFLLLSQIFQGQYHVFPQVHLSSILDEEQTKGQNWNAAFKHINGKSVDFVICDKQYARPLVAVELDDASHTRNDRRTRDQEVERIFVGAGLPLVRFTDVKNISLHDIEEKLRNALVVNQNH